MIVSIFNDVIGPVMRGPSSSHCAAALRIGRLARDLMGGDFSEVLVEFDRGGSLPTTHETQGSDMGLFGGLLGWDAVDDRLPGSARALAEAGVRIRIETVDAGDPHPNTYRLTLRGAGDVRTLRAVSTGGGMVEVVDVDGFAVSILGDRHETLLWVDGNGREVAARLGAAAEVDEVLLHGSGGRQLIEARSARALSDEAIVSLPGVVARAALSPVLPVLSRKGTRVPFGTCGEMLRHDAGRGAPLWRLAAEYEAARGGFSEAEALARMTEIVRVLRRSIAEGVAGTRYDDRILGHQCGRLEELMRTGRLLGGGVLNRVVLYVSALMEAKSAMGVIVAAPTAGACAALPGAVVAAAEESGLGEDAMAKAMLAGGLVGVFIAAGWTFAAEVGGCQAECGAASSMAAAALVSLADGTLAEAVAAASMALQSVLGLVCDPVANRVEVPCLARNVTAATGALACANMALAGYDPVVPLDEVIDAARRVGEQLPRELRCTALGGLSVTNASRAVERDLAARKASARGDRQDM